MAELVVVSQLHFLIYRMLSHYLWLGVHKLFRLYVYYETVHPAKPSFWLSLYFYTVYTNTHKLLFCCCMESTSLDKLACSFLHFFYLFLLSATLDKFTCSFWHLYYSYLLQLKFLRNCSQVFCIRHRMCPFLQFLSSNLS